MENEDAHEETEDVGACREIWAPEFAADDETATGISISSPRKRKLDYARPSPLEAPARSGNSPFGIDSTRGQVSN